VADNRRKHPHSDATYRIVPVAGGAYGVEVSIPDSNPALVTSFATEDAAQAWITEHKRRAGSGFRINMRMKFAKAAAPR
jgi:hypothetical protein